MLPIKIAVVVVVVGLEQDIPLHQLWNLRHLPRRCVCPLLIHLPLTGEGITRLLHLLNCVKRNLQITSRGNTRPSFSRAWQMSSTHQQRCPEWTLPIMLSPKWTRGMTSLEDKNLSCCNGHYCNAVSRGLCSCNSIIVDSEISFNSADICGYYGFICSWIH